MQHNQREKRGVSKEFPQSSASAQIRIHQSPIAQIHSIGETNIPIKCFPVNESPSLISEHSAAGREVTPSSCFVGISHGLPTNFNSSPSSSQIFTTNVELVAASTSNFLLPRMLPNNSANHRPTMLKHTSQASGSQTISSPINKIMKIENSKSSLPDEILVASNFGNPQFHQFFARPSSHDIRLNEPIAHVERFLAPCLTKVTNSSDVCLPSTSKRVSSESTQIKIEKAEKASSGDYYARKQFLLKKSVKSLVLKNAALCDEVSRLNQRIQTVADERKILLKRLLNFEKAKEKRRSTSTVKKATKSSFVLQIPIPSIDQQVNSAMRI